MFVDPSLVAPLDAALLDDESVDAEPTTWPRLHREDSLVLRRTSGDFMRVHSSLIAIATELVRTGAPSDRNENVRRQENLRPRRRRHAIVRAFL